MFFYSDLTTKRVLTPYTYFNGRSNLTSVNRRDLIAALRAATPNQRINRRVGIFEHSPRYGEILVKKSISRHYFKLAMHKRG